MNVMASELERFRAEKDGVFARDPHSPLTADQRRNFRGLAYFDEAIKVLTVLAPSSWP